MSALPPFRLYRFSPIKSHAELMQALEFLHDTCFQLCREALGRHLPVTGNVGIFCHYENEYLSLSAIRDHLTLAPPHPTQKYYQLKAPINIPSKNGIPAATYTHLYIRKPDPYRAQVGDIDFIMSSDEYKILKRALQNGDTVPCARIYDGRSELDMIELHDPDVDALGYISTQRL